jgi:4-oxalocrotonate tautomerase
MEELDMPFINIQLSHELPDKLQIQLVEGVTQIMKSTLGKKAELTATIITTTNNDQWFINCDPLTDINENSAQVIARISENTNTEEEKARAIEQLYDLLDTLCGPISKTSYIMLDEVPMTDWGYGGQTQEHRRINRSADGSIDTEHYLHKGKALRSQSVFNLLSKLRNKLKFV